MRRTLGDRESFGACYRSYRDCRRLSIPARQLIRAQKEPEYPERNIPAFGGHFEGFRGCRIGELAGVKFLGVQLRFFGGQNVVDHVHSSRAYVISALVIEIEHQPLSSYGGNISHVRRLH